MKHLCVYLPEAAAWVCEQTHPNKSSEI